MYGTFYKLDKQSNFSYSYTLDLYTNGSFTLSEKHFEGNPKCNGTWKMENPNFIVLTCDTINDPSETLTNGYMSDRITRLVIINRNKLTYKGVQLSRKR
jgi:hypothetical protein